MLQKGLTKGFTLIELIIVISIIGLLSIIGISSYSSIQADSRNVKRKGDLREIQKALESFKARNGIYPVTQAGGSHVSGHKWQTVCNWSNNSIVVPNLDDTGETGWIPGLAPEFIPVLPHDPRESRANPQRSGGSATQYGGCATAVNNCYKYISNGSDYKLAAHCTPEGNLSDEDPFFDPQRQATVGSVTYRWAWKLSSSSVTNNW